MKTHTITITDKTITVTNSENKVVAQLYFDRDGKLHCDSWIKSES